MDHWADDPWADDIQPQPQPSLAQPSFAQPSFAGPRPIEKEVKASDVGITHAPQLLNAFVDDAQWGNDEGWGDLEDAGQERDTVTVLGGSAADDGWSSGQDLKEARSEEVGGDDWNTSDAVQEEVEELGDGIWEAADVDTSAHQDVSDTKLAPDVEDDLSTRPSISPSERSHTEAAAESPRTSFEEEKHVGTDNGAHAASEAQAGTEVAEDTGQPSVVASASEANLQEPEAPPSEHASVGAASLPVTGTATDNPLLSKLFPPSPTKELPPAPDDPIFSTSARKSWYRLTRKETMREFNSGSEENTYVRVNWATSQIRTDVLKVVQRWTTEDRISGRGHARGVSFYWDQPAPAVRDLRNTASHSRDSSLVDPSARNKPAAKAAAADAPAAFNWSSFPSDEVWESEKRDSHDISDSTGQHRSERSSISTHRTEPPWMEAPTPSNGKSQGDHPALLISPIPPSEPQFLPPPPPTTTKLADLSDATDHTDVLPIVSNPDPTSILSTDNDDDDDWGEMIQSPTSPPPTFSTFFPPPTTGQPYPPRSTTPVAPQSSPPHTPPSKHATPIVRLQGTVSPTSAIFKPPGFIPLHAEQGPIGPDLLKRTAKSASRPPVSNVHSASREEKDMSDEAWADDNDFSASSGSPPTNRSAQTGFLQQATQREEHADDVVKSIVSGLPDLSYMLLR
ncbi:hypothetical protein M011DRAFT_96446 [Sporormia fimetaria CBS 119925]|uniref:Uncharacterized protein n=1 Tax=Sporormia fimetaria CBS 119925 TaxID=1340428 RepID=A0A6A6V9U2_9PLEO|nr:hypothetical protein M011DRAFT_96446 [Sporormia fimetaria CBS 119925]